MMMQRMDEIHPMKTATIDHTTGVTILTPTRSISKCPHQAGSTHQKAQLETGSSMWTATTTSKTSQNTRRLTMQHSCLKAMHEFGGSPNLRLERSQQTGRTSRRPSSPSSRRLMKKN